MMIIDGPETKETTSRTQQHFFLHTFCTWFICYRNILLVMVVYSAILVITWWLVACWNLILFFLAWWGMKSTYPELCIPLLTSTIRAKLMEILVLACFGQISVAQQILRLRQWFKVQSSCLLRFSQFHREQHGCSIVIERVTYKSLKFSQHDITLHAKVIWRWFVWWIRWIWCVVAETDRKMAQIRLVVLEIWVVTVPRFTGSSTAWWCTCTNFKK